MLEKRTSSYFSNYSRQFVVSAVLAVLASSLPSDGLTARQLDIRPYRIITTLLDKQEIGPDIIDDIILDIFR